MITVERHDVILSELRRAGVVHVDALAVRLAVSRVTVRRDLRELADRGLLLRVRGGGVLPGALAGPASAIGPASAVGPASPVGWGGPASLGGTGSPGGPAHRASQSTGLVVGMVVPSLDYYFPQITRAVQAAANTFGLRVALRGSTYGSAASDQHQIEQLLGISVAGMLLTPSCSMPEREPLLDWVTALDMPIVLIERQPPSTRGRWAVLESVGTDHELGAALAVEHLASLGHRSIGMVTTFRSPTSEPLRSGFSAATRRHGLNRRKIIEIDGDDVTVGSAAAVRVLDACLSMGVTALLVHADRQAAALSQAARELGVDVPGRLSVISYDDEVAAAFDPPLTAIRTPRSAIGQAATELLAARLARGPNRRPPCRMRFAPQLIPRQSTSRPARR